MCPPDLDAEHPNAGEFPVLTPAELARRCAEVREDWSDLWWELQARQWVGPVEIGHGRVARRGGTRGGRNTSR